MISTLRNIIFKVLKAKDKREKKWKVVREKWFTTIKLTAYFTSKAMGPEGSVTIYSKFCKKKNHLSTKNPVSSKSSFKNESELKAVSVK